jgi:hypothetical protein
MSYPIPTHSGTWGCIISCRFSCSETVVRHSHPRRKRLLLFQLKKKAAIIRLVIIHPPNYLPFFLIFLFIIHDRAYYFPNICLIFLSTLFHPVGTQGQTDSVYFHLSNDYDIVPHSLLLRKLQLNFPLVMSIGFTAT